MDGHVKLNNGSGNKKEELCSIRKLKIQKKKKENMISVDEFRPSPLEALLLLVLWLEFGPGYQTGPELVCQEYSSSLPSHSHAHAGS
jgi:hypothetical protein